jgi:hypothetical protein
VRGSPLLPLPTGEVTVAERSLCSQGNGEAGKGGLVSVPFSFKSDSIKRPARFRTPFNIRSDCQQMSDSVGRLKFRGAHHGGRIGKVSPVWQTIF